MKTINIPAAREMWANNTKKDDFERSCEKVVRDIQKAANEGMRKVCFDPDPRQYEAVKREFEARGYHFTPTGCIGGVWQRTENINW